MSGDPDPEPAPEAELSRAELDRWIERHLALLRYYVRLRAGPLLRSRETVDDVVQSAVREIYSSPGPLSFPNAAAFRRYLYTVATHKIISKSRHYQAQRRSPERALELSDAQWDLPEPGASRPSRSPSRQAEQADDLARLRSAFDALDEDDRQILTLRKIFDVPTREIAEQMSMPESTVRWRLSGILAELAARMG